MWNELLEHYQKKSCLVDSNHWPTPWATYNSMLSAYHASRGSFNLHFSLLPWFASFLREKKNLFQKQSRPFPVEYGRVVISNFGMINQRNPILYSAFTVWFEWQVSSHSKNKKCFWKVAVTIVSTAHAYDQPENSIRGKRVFARDVENEVLKQVLKLKRKPTKKRNIIESSLLKARICQPIETAEFPHVTYILDSHWINFTLLY